MLGIFRHGGEWRAEARGGNIGGSGESWEGVSVEARGGQKEGVVRWRRAGEGDGDGDGGRRWAGSGESGNIGGGRGREGAAQPT